VRDVRCQDSLPYGFSLRNRMLNETVVQAHTYRYSAAGKPLLNAWQWETQYTAHRRNSARGWAQSNVIPTHRYNQNVISLDVIPQKLILCSHLERPFVESCRLHCKSLQPKKRFLKMTKQGKKYYNQLSNNRISYLQCLLQPCCDLLARIVRWPNMSRHTPTSAVIKHSCTPQQLELFRWTWAWQGKEKGKNSLL